MVCNEWMVPLWQFFNRAHSINARWLQQVRRGAIAALLLAAWLLEQQLSGRGGLASLGLLSFAAAAQLMPSIIAALYWPRAHSRGLLPVCLLVVQFGFTAYYYLLCWALGIPCSVMVRLAGRGCGQRHCSVYNFQIP